MFTNKLINRAVTDYGSLQKAIDELKSVEGLTKIILLNNLDKLEFKILEDSNNFGVSLALARRYALVIVHDSNFRQPMGSMVLKHSGELIFPPLPFPELKAWNVVSSSPSAVLHKYIVNRFDLDLTPEEATLIIGFDL